MAIQNTVYSNFDPRSSIAEKVFDCRLSGVELNPISGHYWPISFEWGHIVTTF